MQNLNPSVNVNWVPGITLEEMEKSCILAALRFYRGNKTQTAGALGIAIRTLDHKLEKYEADSKREQDRFESDKQERASVLDRLRGVEFTKQNAAGNSYQALPEQRRSAVIGMEAESGEHVESASKPSAQPTMSMSERKEVQGVLPKHAAPDSKHKGRRSL